MCWCSRQFNLSMDKGVVRQFLRPALPHFEAAAVDRGGTIKSVRAKKRGRGRSAED